MYHPLSSCEQWQLKYLNNWQEYWWWKSLQILKKSQIEALKQILNLHGVYTHYNILTGISVTEWPLIYLHIIYSDFKDSSNNFKDLLWDPVEQDTRSSKFYREENVLLWQIYRHLEFWPATWKALLDTWGCFLADITTRCNLLSWRRGKMWDTKPTGEMNKSSGFPHQENSRSITRMMLELKQRLKWYHVAWNNLYFIVSIIQHKRDLRYVIHLPLEIKVKIWWNWC